MEILISLVKWVFISNHRNYARRLSVHIQNFLFLTITSPQLYQEFERANFAVQIKRIQSSRLHNEEVHEQSNRTTKSIKEAINFVNRAGDELQKRWEIKGTKIAKYLMNVERKILKNINKNDTNHYEYNSIHNATFTKDCTNIVGRLLPIISFLDLQSLESHFTRSNQTSHIVRMWVLSSILYRS